MPYPYPYLIKFLKSSADLNPELTMEVFDIYFLKIADNFVLAFNKGVSLEIFDFKTKENRDKYVDMINEAAKEIICVAAN